MIKREIRFSRSSYNTLKDHLLKDPRREQAAIIIGGKLENDQYRAIIVNEVIPVPAEYLLHQSYGAVEPDPEFLLPILNRCTQFNLSFAQSHSHPWDNEKVSFSQVDIRGEVKTFAFINERCPNILQASLVFGQKSVDGHFYCPEFEETIPLTSVRIVDSPMELITPTTIQNRQSWIDSLDYYDYPSPQKEIDWQRLSRQVLAFGEVAQKRLSSLKVAIIGLGGLGCHVAQQLAYLGTNLLLVDDQKLERSNLNREVGASISDIGQNKVEVAERMVKLINPGTKTTAITAKIEDVPPSIITSADIIVGCLDRQFPRLILNRYAVQYYIPYIDLGVGFEKAENGIFEVGGQVKLVMPDGPCLFCHGSIDREILATELLKPEERHDMQRAGYGLGDEVPQPAVISIGGTIASLAVTEILSLITGFKPNHNYIYYDVINQMVNPVIVKKLETCPACGTNSSAAMGDLDPIITKFSGKAKLPEVMA